MTFKLNNQIEMPSIAFGTYNRNLNLVDDLVKKAIDVGFNHFDTAAIYRNEDQVGQAINGYERANFFIVSKLPMNGFKDDKVDFYLQRSLNKLRIDYLDLYLIHAPFAIKYKSEEEFYPVGEDGMLLSDDLDYVITWKSMERIYRQGKVKAIGVSNFNQKQLQRILDACEIKPMVNQIEVNIYFQNKELIKFCKENLIQICAFAPLGSPKHFNSDHFSSISNSNRLLANDMTIQKIAKKYQKSWAQICLRFLTQQQIIPVVGADNEHQLKENINCNKFDLEENDLNELKMLDKNMRIFFFEYAPGYENVILFY